MIFANAAGLRGGAFWIGGNATLNALGGDIAFSRNLEVGRPNAIYLNNTAGATTTTFNAPAGRTITFFDPVDSNAAAGVVSVTKIGAGMVSFDGSLYPLPIYRSSLVYADTQVLEGTFEVANDAFYGVHAAAVGGTASSAFTTAAGTTLQGGVLGTVIADRFTLGGDLSIAGRQPDTRGIFTIDTNTATLGSGSRVLFNTFLNDGVVQNTDLLVLNLNGTATTGQSSILVTNVGGPGAQTVGDGIKLVQTNNGTTAGAFTLGGRVAAGAFEYLLFYGGNAQTGGDPEDQNWYLRNIVTPPPPGPPSPPGPPPPPVPNYRVEVPVDSTLPLLAQRMGLGMLGTYHDRVGEDYPGPVAPAEEVFCKDPARNFRCAPTPEQAAVYAGAGQQHMAAWGRVFGESGDVAFGGDGAVGRLSNFLDHGPSYDFDLWGLQAGMDLYRRLDENGTRDVAGFYLGYARATADVEAVFGGPAGSSDINGYSLGAYWTRQGDKGWYIDAVLQGTRYDDAHGDSSLGESLDSDGWGFAASLEGGYPFQLGQGWAIEPQAQLVYQHVALDDGADSFGLISFADSDAVYGRLGARLTRKWLTEAERHMTFWARGDVWSSFGADAQTTFASLNGGNPLTFNADLGGAWARVGFGLSAEIAQNVSLFGSGDYNFGFDAGDFSSWSGRAGLKVKW